MRQSMNLKNKIPIRQCKFQFLLRLQSHILVIGKAIGIYFMAGADENERRNQQI